MKKITELTETRFRTLYQKDEYGNNVRYEESYEAYRNVNTVSAGQRFGNLIIDGICYYCIYAILGYLYSMVDVVVDSSVTISLTAGIVLFFGSLLSYPLFYYVFENTWQRTPAKYLMRSVVIDKYGNRPETRSIVLRSIARIVPFEFLSVWWSAYSRGWHDRWSETYVVSEEELAELKKLQEEQKDK